jgi:hypothetical protein
MMKEYLSHNAAPYTGSSCTSAQSVERQPTACSIQQYDCALCSGSMQWQVCIFGSPAPPAESMAARCQRCCDGQSLVCHGQHREVVQLLDDLHSNTRTSAVVTDASGCMLVLARAPQALLFMFILWSESLANCQT